MSPTTFPLRSAAAATLVAGLLVVAPVLGGAAALAEEPGAAASSPVPTEAASEVPVEPAVEPASEEADAEPATSPSAEAVAPASETIAAPTAEEEPEPEASAPDSPESVEPEPAAEEGGEEQPVLVAQPQALAAPAALEEFVIEEATPQLIGADGCEYTFVVQEGSVSISDITGCTDVVVPAEIGGFPVERVGAFSTEVTMSGAPQFTSLVLPDSLFAVGPGAFKNADALVSVDFGTGVQRIEGRAFADADALTAITLPNSVRFVGARAFEGAGAVASLDLASVQQVEGLAFSGLGQVTELVVPATVTRAADTAFGNMPRLRSVLIEGDPSAFVRFTFVNSVALEDVEFRNRSATATIAGNMFVGAGLLATPTVFFRDGAFGKSCALDDGETLRFGGTTMVPQCLFDVTFDLDAGLRSELRQFNIREGSVVTDVPAVEVPDGKVFAGFSPDVAEPVVADTLYVPVFVDPVPGDYTPSEDDLIEEKQCCFVAPATVEAGQEMTLTVIDEEPDPGETIEPLPLETPDPAPSEPATEKTLVPSPEKTAIPAPEPTLPEDPAEDEGLPEDFDPNDFIDVFLFSEPIELLITGFSENSVTVLVPETVEPGEHKVAIYSVFGELFGWQPITVTAAAPPAGEEPGDEAPADDAAGDDEAADDAAGDDAAADDAAADAGLDEVADEAAAVDAEADVEAPVGLVLAATGAPEVWPAVAGALALLTIGGALIVSRRHSVGRRTQP
ncbi:leucine-rich repeat protein [Demequina mangrovi]|uniref:Leucine rich repeat-containing protein n=1 Tax=Demequina mangrovi TaxID=1043493 RepID=A0A1H7AKG9_9MICO|nr:leucine-rich repeat domain-containing protein [Demequina mangrovi]SEJ64377.1 Leucine rich repeat-containing protein [Demequina mangrovi]